MNFDFNARWMEILAEHMNSIDEIVAEMDKIALKWKFDFLKKKIDKLISRLKSIGSIQEFKVHHQKESKQIIKQSYFKPVNFYLRLSPVQYTGRNFCKS